MIIFEPALEQSDSLEVWICASGASADWGGAIVWASYDGVTYSKVGTVPDGVREGVLTAALPTIAENPLGQTLDVANTLSVDLTMSLGALASSSAADAVALNTASYVDGEIIAYATATLTSQYRYDLKYLVRGAYGSTISSHASGTKFARLDGNVLKLAYTKDRIGATVFLKFQSFNSFGGGTEDLSTVAVYPHTIQGGGLAAAPADVANLRTVFDGGFKRLWWDEITDGRPVEYEVRKGASWGTALTVEVVASPPLLVFGSDTYWVAARVEPAPGLVVYSANPQSIALTGTALTTNLASWDEQATGWTGTLAGGTVVQGGVLTLASTTTATVEGGGLSHAGRAARASYRSLGSFTRPYWGGGEPILIRRGGNVTDQQFGALGFPGSSTMALLYGTYEIPAAHSIDLGVTSTVYVNASWVGAGLPTGSGITSLAAITPYLATALSQYVDIHLEISAATQTGTAGVHGFDAGIQLTSRALPDTQGRLRNATGTGAAGSWSMVRPQRQLLTKTIGGSTAAGGGYSAGFRQTPRVVTDQYSSLNSIVTTPTVGGTGKMPIITRRAQVSAQSGGFFQFSTLDWAPWQKFTPGVYVGRYFKFRAVLSTVSPDVQPFLFNFAFTIGS